MRFFIIATFFFVNIVTANAASPVGTWRTGDGKAKVKVTKCSAGICARIISLRQPNGANGKPLRDQNNPKAHLRKRPIIGISLFMGMRPSGNGAWRGRLYSPEKGGVFSGYVTQLSRNMLKIKGCMGSSTFLCQSKMWKRIK